MIETVPVAGSEPTSRAGDAAQNAAAALADAQQAIVDLATSTAAKLDGALPKAGNIDHIEVGFGLSISAKGNVIVAGAAAEASLQVSIVFRSSAD